MPHLGTIHAVPDAVHYQLVDIIAFGLQQNLWGRQDGFNLEERGVPHQGLVEELHVPKGGDEDGNTKSRSIISSPG